MTTRTRPAQIFRAVFNTIQNGVIDWDSDHEKDAVFSWYFKRPFTIHKRTDEHIGDRHSTTWQYTFYKRYFWQVEWRYKTSYEVDEADEFFAPSEDTWRR